MGALRIWVALAVLSVVGGCVGTTDLLGFASASDAPKDVKTVNVAGQDVILGQANGYCFNHRQSRVSATGAFVVLGPCDALDEGSTAKGLITINVLARSGMKDAIKSHELETYFKTKAGKAALSRTGDPDKLEILGTMQEDGFIFVHTKDASGPIIPDTFDEQWRVFFVVSDRLVSVAMINFVDDPMSDGLMFTHMESIARRIQSLNP